MTKYADAMAKLVSKIPDAKSSPEMIVCRVFQATADATGGDILQCCRDCGEEEVIYRDGLYDYLDAYGGEYGATVQKWLMEIPGSIKDLEGILDTAGVYKTWS